MNVRVDVKFNRFPQGSALARGGIGRAFSDQGNALLADMQQRTPVDTGALRDSERVTTTETSITLIAGNSGDAQHAIYVHQGTARMGARPFMAQAVAGGQPALVAAMVEAINEALG